MLSSTVPLIVKFKITFLLCMLLELLVCNLACFQIDDFFKEKNQCLLISYGICHVLWIPVWSCLFIDALPMIFQLMLYWWLVNVPLILQEHLLIVCELLKANLYEFHKFNRESGGEVYFTMPRLQVCGVSFSSWELLCFFRAGRCAYFDWFCSQLPFSVSRHFSFYMALA